MVNNAPDYADDLVFLSNHSEDYFKIYYDEFENAITDVLYIGRLQKLPLKSLYEIQSKLIYAMGEVNEEIYKRNFGRPDSKPANSSV